MRVKYRFRVDKKLVHSEQNQ